MLLILTCFTDAFALPTLRRTGRPRKRRWGRGRPSRSPSPVVVDNQPVVADISVITPTLSTSITSNVAVQPPDSWSDDPFDAPTLPKFTGSPQVNVSCVDGITPLSILYEILTEEFFDDVVRQTNLYVQQKQASGVSTSHSTFSNWVPITTVCLKKFIAVCIHMGIVKKPHYWSLSDTFKEAFFSPCFAKFHTKNVYWS